MSTNSTLVNEIAPALMLHNKDKQKQVSEDNNFQEKKITQVLMPLK